MIGVAVAQPPEQVRVLKDFYIATNGHNWFKQWNLTAPLCGQHGIICNQNKQVTQLILNSTHLVGTIPSSLIQINLQKLDLRNNKLFGTVPPLNVTNSIALSGNPFNCPVTDYSKLSKTTDFVQSYSSTLSCKGSQSCYYSDSGAPVCRTRHTRTLHGKLKPEITWSAPTIAPDNTCCLGSSTLSFFAFSFSPSQSGDFVISVNVLENSNSQDSYIHIFRDSYKPNSYSISDIIALNDDISSLDFLSRTHVFLSSSSNYYLIVSSLEPIENIVDFSVSIKGPENFQIELKCTGETANNAEYPTTPANSLAIGKCHSGHRPNGEVNDGNIPRKCLENGEWENPSVGCETVILPPQVQDYIIHLIAQSITKNNEELKQTIDEQGKVIEEQRVTISKLQQTVSDHEQLQKYRRMKPWYGIPMDGKGSNGGQLRSFVVDNNLLYVIAYNLVKVFNINSLEYQYTHPLTCMECSFGFLTKEGDILIPDRKNHVIYMIEKTNKLSSTRFMGEQGNTNILNGPSGVAIDDDGLIVISEILNGRVSIFDPSNKVTPRQRIVGLNYPECVYFHPIHKHLFVTDGANNRIMIYYKNNVGLYVPAFERYLGFWPHTVTFDNYGNYIVPDANGRLVFYEGDGTFVRDMPSAGPIHMIQKDDLFWLATDRPNNYLRVLSSWK